MNDPFEGLREIAHACFKNSRDHGWHEETKVGPYLRALLAEAEKKLSVPPDILDTLGAFARQMERDKDAPIMVKLALIVSEVGEAIEAYRNPNLDPAKSYYARKDEDSHETFLCEMPPEGSEMMSEDYEKMKLSKPEGPTGTAGSWRNDGLNARSA